MAEVSADKPDLSQVHTPAEFVDAMRRLKSWTGLGYRLLEKRAATAGEALPRSTLTVALTRQTLPREDLVTAFARACGCDEEEIGQWVAARRRIAGAAAPAMSEVPVSRRTRARRVALVAGALAGAAALTVFLAGLSAPPAPSPDLAAPAQSPSASATPTAATPPTDTTATTGTTLTTASTAPSPGGPPQSSGSPIQLAAKPSASEAPRPLPHTVTVLTQPPSVAPPPPVQPVPLPRCADVAYRHVGPRRVQLPAHSSSLDCVLSYGAKGEGVEALQAALIFCNNAKYVTLTGMYDQKTAEAVLFIQSAGGNQAADGIYGPETRASLNWIHHNGTDGTCTPYHDK
jgi:hypothetical protein